MRQIAPKGTGGEADLSASCILPTMAPTPYHARSMRMICENDSTRLDLFLGQRLNLSRVQSRRLLHEGLVRVNRQAVSDKDKGRRLIPGDQVEVVSFEHPSGHKIKPNSELPLEILAQGEGWVAVNKPVGMSVHPLRSSERDTVLSALAARYPELSQGPGIGEGGLRSGVVHRLDRGTSGTLLVALSQPCWQRLRDAFRKHRIEKTYLALVHGRMSGTGRERMTLAVTQHRPARVRVVDSSGIAPSGARSCTLAWRSMEVLDEASLVKVRLGTGFLHQIRAMFAHLGHPLLGDTAYGGGDIMRAEHSVAVARPMLHAHWLGLDESGGEKIAVRCEPPADFRELLDIMRRQP